MCFFQFVYLKVNTVYNEILLKSWIQSIIQDKSHLSLNVVQKKSEDVTGNINILIHTLIQVDFRVFKSLQPILSIMPGTST